MDQLIRDTLSFINDHGALLMVLIILLLISGLAGCFLIEKHRFTTKEITLMGMLVALNVIMAELCKNVTIPCEMAFISASSYRGTMTTGNVNAQTDGLPDLTGRHVVLVEDILDTGLTLSYICKVLSSRGTASLEICSMMDKPSRRKTELKGKYVGFEIPDEFVVGYGLDFNEKYRNLPFVGVLKPEVYEK